MKSMIYMNSIHPIETHDSTTMENVMGLVVGGQGLHEGYDQRILLLINPCP